MRAHLQSSMPITLLQSGGNSDLAWNSDTLTATVDGRRYSHPTRRGCPLDPEEEAAIRSLMPVHYTAHYCFRPGVGRIFYVTITFHFRDLFRRTLTEQSYELHEIV